jgi:hypothetical protein
MTENSSLTPAPTSGTTGNPQSDNQDVNAINSNSFQQSASPDVLNQNRPLTVTETGKPVTGGAISGGSLALMWVFIVVASIVLIMIASSVFKWVMKKPESTKKKSAGGTDTKKVDKPKATVVTKSHKSKKKLSRSKRNK